MKTLLHFSLLVVSLSLPIAEVRAQSQHEMNQQAYADFEKADAALNKIYTQVLAKLDAEGQGKLRAAQRAWVTFRDAQAEVDADSERGGSAASLFRARSLTGSTVRRTQDLKDLLKQVDDE